MILSGVSAFAADTTGTASVWNNDFHQSKPVKHSNEVGRIKPRHCEDIRKYKKARLQTTDRLLQKIDELADEISKGCDLAEQLIKANAPIEQILYVMSHDYTGESYYPSRIIPPDDSLGVEPLCQILTLWAKKSAGL